jgi:hypothetical protein
MKTAAALTVALLAAAEARAELPQVMAHHGRLLNADDTQVNGTASIGFKISRLEHKPSAGTTETFAWEQAAQTVTVWNGFYTVILGSDVNPLDENVFVTAEQRWLVVTVNGEEMEPRLRFGIAAYALVAANAANATNAVNAVNAVNATNAAVAANALDADHADLADVATLAHGVDCDHCLAAAEIDQSTLDGIDAATLDGFDASATPAAGKLLALGNDAKFPAAAIPSLDAPSVNGITASTTPAPNKLLPLDGDAKIPLSVLPGGPAGLDAATVKGHALLTESGTGKILVLDANDQVPATSLSLAPVQITTLQVEGDVSPTATPPYLKVVLPSATTKVVSAQGYVFDNADGSWKLLGRPVSVLVAPGAVIPSNLAAYWKFDEVAGSRRDSTSNQFALVEMGTPSVAAVSGKFGNAARFTGANHLFLTRSAYSSTGLAFGGVNNSYVAWVRRNNSGLQQSPFSEYGAGTDTWRVGIWFSGTSTTEHYYGRSHTDSSSIPAVNEWHHIAVVNNGVQVKGYRDGVEGASFTCGSCTATAGISSTSGFFVGCHAQANSATDTSCHSGTTYNFVGDVDELAVFNKALTVAEIQSIMANGVDPTSIVERVEIHHAGSEVRLVNRESSTLKLRLVVSY